MSFTVHLPKYDYSQIFNRDKFISMFPDSLLAVAFTDPEEKEVSLENPSVTPYVLQFLSDVMTRTSPYVLPLDMTPASRYLLIPLLAVVSDPKYRMFREQYDYINILNPQDLDDMYSEILNFAVMNEYPSLLSHLWDYTDYTDHPTSNLTALILSVYKNDLSIFRTLLPKVPDPTQAVDISQVRDEMKIDPALNYIKSITVIEGSALGKSNTILSYIISNPQFNYRASDWYNSLYISAILQNYEAIDMIRPLTSDEYIKVLAEEAGDRGNLLLVSHLVVPIGTPITPKNVLQAVIVDRIDEALPIVLRNINDELAHQVIQDNINTLSADQTEIIIKTKRDDIRFIRSFYNLVLDSKNWVALTYFDNPITFNKVWSDIFSRITAGELYSLLDNPEIHFSEHDNIDHDGVLLNLSLKMERDDLYEVIEQEINKAMYG